MKSRVAVPAALIALIALVLIPVYSSLNIAADRNASAQEALRGFCQVTGSMTEQSSEAERAGVLETLLLPAGASSALYSSDGTLVYASSEELSAPAKRVFTSALERRARSVTAEDVYKRQFGKSDYIPCIAWGRNAQYAARFGVGDRISLTGRLQSREYQKLLDVYKRQRPESSRRD